MHQFIAPFFAVSQSVSHQSSSSASATSVSAMPPLTWGVLGFDAITLNYRNSDNLMWSLYKAETKQQVSRVFNDFTVSKSQSTSCMLEFKKEHLAAKVDEVCVWLQLHLAFPSSFPSHFPFTSIFSFLSHCFSSHAILFLWAASDTGIFPNNFSFLLWSHDANEPIY